MKKIQILDYGSGNLFSIQDSIRRVSEGVEVIVDDQYNERSVDALVLPGVGSFTSAQKILMQNKKAILEDTKRGMPLLGICLGMQLMFEKSEEGPGEGLGLFEGEVKRFVPTAKRKVPHMGWNTITVSKEGTAFCKGLESSEWVYYVHSFFPEPKDEDTVQAFTDYEGQRFPAIIVRKNVFGTQFHPEKSNGSGARMIANFVELVQRSKEFC